MKPKLATEAWVRRGLLDFFVAFELENLLNFRLFCLHQGVEKFCKAYLIASQSHQYEHLNADEAGKWIDGFTKNLGHDLHSLLGFVAVGLDTLEGYVKDTAFIDLLNIGYEEGRYPKPIAKSIWSKHGFPALASDRTDKKAFALGALLFEGVDRRFKATVPLETPIYERISRETWERFVRIWELRKRHS